MTPVKYIVTRDVAKDEPNNCADRDVAAGEIFEAYDRSTWGAVDDENGIALTGPDGEFFEFPLNAVGEFRP